MNNAITTLTALTTLALQAAEAADRVSQMIATAHAEDRDLTTAEIETIQSERQQAVQRWHDVTGDA